MTVYGVIVGVFFVIVCILLVLIVLLQKGRGGGLGAALGGMGSAAFGTRVGDMMTWVTIVLTSLFLLLAIIGYVVLRPDEHQAEAPQFVPKPGAGITADIRVTIKARNERDTVFYTIDGSTPSQKNGEEYKEHPFRVSPGTVVKAIAYPPRGRASEVVEAHYRAPRPNRPRFNPEPNLLNPITGPIQVTIEKGAEGDKVYFTTDGSDPDENSRPYTAPVTVRPNTVLKARAFARHALPGEIAAATYGLKAPEPMTRPSATGTPTTVPATGPAGSGGN